MLGASHGGRSSPEVAVVDQRFFCKIFARNPEHLAALAERNLDLLHQTASQAEDGTTRVDGLLSLDEVRTLVERGYRVLVEEDASKRARAHEVLRADEWIKRFEERG
jgi:hypothetical protein